MKPSAVTVAAAAAFAACFAAVAQTPPPYQPARTASGHPDLQGVWYAIFLTELERPDDVRELVIPPEQAAALVKKLTRIPEGVYDPDADHFWPDKLLSVRGELRTSLLVEPADGKMPYTRLAKALLERADAMVEESFDQPEERPTSERCVSGLGNAPIHAVGMIPHQIVQTANEMLLVTEDSDPVRIIDMTARRPPATRSRSGYATGRWEGDTLVVETTNLLADDPSGALYRDAVVLSANSRIVERFTLLSEVELLYQYTVVDPALYDRPWLAELSFQRLDDKVYEYACHESNYSIVNALLAARLGRQTKRKIE